MANIIYDSEKKKSSFKHIIIMIISPILYLYRDSIVGIAIGYGFDDRGVGVRVSVGSRIFCSSHRREWLWCPPNLLSNGYRGFFPGVKRLRREADHSPSTTAEVKQIRIYTSIPPIRLRSVVLY
jgi:hypothetical protein